MNNHYVCDFCGILSGGCEFLKNNTPDNQSPFGVAIGNIYFYSCQQCKEELEK